jgi:5,10-methylenetetrahydromethanopterin reductase
MALTFEGEVTPVLKPREMMELAQLAETSGLDRLGISDVIFYRDTYQIQALCALATKRLKIGSLVTNPYTRHPTVIAAAAATLQEISDGRAFIGIGAGAGLNALQVVNSPPAPTLKEAVQIIRQLLAGDTVKHHGKIYRLDDINARLEFPPHQSVPILIGTRSPQIAKLAAELADIIVIGGRYISERQFTTYLEWIAEGAALARKRPHDMEVAPRLTVCCSIDGELARQSVKLYAAHYLALLKPPDLLVDEEKLNKIVQAVKRVKGWYFSPNVRYPKEIDDLVDEEIIDKFAIAGTPDECIGKIRTLTAKFRFRSISLNLAAVRRDSIYDGLAETVKCLEPVIQSVKSN